MNPVIHVAQNSSLLDTSLEIQISNLPPHQVVTVQAKMRDNLGTSWQSFAEFKSDSKGEINLAKAQPLSGTYSTSDTMGLFWSMIPLTYEPKRKTPLQPLETKITVMKEHEILATHSVTRHVASPAVDRIPVRERGLVGTFFCHSKSGPLPTIIVLGGSEGGLRESNAALLASYGFNTLALAYFGMEDLPKELIDIPLDYIEKAIDWLTDYPKVDDTRIGLMGTSRGGELALLSASIFPSIKAVVGFVPSGVIYPGIGQSAIGFPSWQFKGKSFPFAYGEVPKEVGEEIQQAKQAGKPISWRKTYHFWAEGEKEAEIEVENIKGPVLLISGGDDQLWPSDVLSEKVITRLKEHNHPYDYEHINYPEAGHSFGPPCLPTTQLVLPYGDGIQLLFGGNPKDNAHAQFDAWQRVKVFFDQHLADSSISALGSFNRMPE